VSRHADVLQALAGPTRQAILDRLRKEPPSVGDIAEGAGRSTPVELVHRGWQRLGDEAKKVRASYEGGWEAAFGSAIAAAASRRRGE
jgi:DNA-binding transcriptional ArsR family regulator